LSGINYFDGYGGQVLFRDVGWRIADRERIGLVGPNGAGKTTLCRMPLRPGMTDAREAAAAEALRRTPAARHGLVRRLLQAPPELPALVSLPTDQLLLRAPTPRPPRRYLRAKVALERWTTLTAAALRRAAKAARGRLRNVLRARR